MISPSGFAVEAWEVLDGLDDDEELVCGLENPDICESCQ
jgi:hypothetical protein